MKFLLRLISPRALLAAGLLAILAMPAAAQRPDREAVLVAGLIKTKGYTVGSPLSASGLHRFDGDTVWTHVGWNHPRISAVAADPNDPDVLFLAAGNGVLRTLDGGRSWRLATGWEVTESQDVAVDPGAPEHVYVATAYGVWRSTDRGMTWTESNEGLAKTYTQVLAVDRRQTGRLFAGTEGGLYVSTDGAQTWSLAISAGVPVLDVTQSRMEPDLWLAATEGRGVLRSTDGGRTWSSLAGPLACATVYAVTVDPYDARRMAAAGWDTGVFVSTDGGTTWTQRREGLPVPHLYEVVFDANVQGRLWAATVEQGIYRSDDLGRTWAYAGLDGTLVFDLTFIEKRN